MSYEESVSEVGRHLALLLAESDAVPATEVDNALGGRESVLRLLDTLAERGGLGHSGVAVNATPEQVAGDPVGLMNSARRRMGRLPDADSHARLAAEPTSRVGALWLGLHRHAVAAREQIIGTTGETPTPKVTGLRDGPLKHWSHVADGAAILGAVVELDRPLIEALRADGRAGTTRDGSRTEAYKVLLDTHSAGVGLAVAGARTLAAAGPLPDPEPLRPARIRPAAVRTRKSQREGHRRLAALLREIQGLRPEEYRAILAHHVATVVAAAELVTNPVHAKILSEHAAGLEPLDRALSRTASLEPGDGRAFAQAQELTRFVSAELTGARLEDVGLTVLRALPETSRSLAQALERDRPTWLVAGATEADKYLWVRADVMACRQADADALITAPKAMAVPASELTMLAMAGAPVPPDPIPGYLADARLIPPRETLAGPLGGAPTLERPVQPGLTLTDHVHAAKSKAAARGADAERG